MEKIECDSCTKIDIKGNVSKGVKTLSGDVEVQGMVDGDVSTQSGDVECGNITGSVKTMSGDVKSQGNIIGNVNTMSGDIKYKKVQGMVDGDVSTQSGDVECGNIIPETGNSESGHSGIKQSDETKNKRIESLKKSSFYETVKSENFRKKMSEIIKNNFKNESTINKLRNSKLGNKNPQYGKTTSDKQKETVKELHKKGKIILSDEGRKKIIENSKKRKGKKNENIRCDVIKYYLKSPTNETFIIYGARKLQDFCSRKNIRYHILKKNINVLINNKHINNSKYETSLNTIGWIITKN